MKKYYLAGIVLYNPDSKRLRENISAIISQVDKLVLIENGSRDQLYLSEIDVSDKIVVLQNGENRGIAGALNQILQYAEEHGYEWALTLDQDSIVSSNIIQIYDQYVDEKNVGMLTCSIVDRNFSFAKRNDKGGYIDFCISSGSYVRVGAWKHVGGFDETMFIDSVDLDFCLNLRTRDWKIFRTDETNILHEVGNSKVVRIFGKEYLALNHSIIRYYYIVRNLIYVGRKHNMRLKSFKITIRLFYTVLLYEHQRTSKLRNMIKGFFVGLTCKIRRHD